ncbi:hypothetical protein D3C75_1387180 [compost metagenome]
MLSFEIHRIWNRQPVDSQNGNRIGGWNGDGGAGDYPADPLPFAVPEDMDREDRIRC